MVAAVAPVAVVPPDVMRLSAARLREELRKRGRATGGNKSAMQERLNEAIDLNVLVSEEWGVNEARHPDFMAGLDVTAKWELLTQCNNPVPESSNNDNTLQPPTKINATLNPKYGFVKMFNRIPFTGTTKKMRYCRPDG
jgi:hypothetical protein